jgi:Protein of unknown function (DUF721).
LIQKNKGFSSGFHMKRTPYGYNGTQKTTILLSSLLPNVVKHLNHETADLQQAMILAWPNLVGERIATMTKILKVDYGTITVAVSNPSLHQVLRTEKPKLLKAIQARLPQLKCHNIVFCIR